MTLPKTSKDIFLAIDANAIIHRAYHAYPQTLQTEDGIGVNAVYGFTTMLLAALESFHPEYVICAMDTHAPTFRHEMYPSYKGTRKPTDQSLIDQFPLVEEVLKAFNIPVIKMEGFEADDILGSLSEYVDKGLWSNQNLDMYILSGDKDLLQLIKPNVRICLPNGSFKNIVVYDRDMVKEKYGYYPEQVVDYKAIVGDSSDNIPGVKGVGDKTVVELLNEYGSLNEIYKNISELKPRVQTLLGEGIEQAEFSRELATIRTDLKLDVHLEECKLTDFDRSKLTYTFKKYSFRSLLPKLDELFGVEEYQSNTSQLDIFSTQESVPYSKYEEFGKDLKDIVCIYIPKEESFDETEFLFIRSSGKDYLTKEIDWIQGYEGSATFYNWEQLVSDISLYDYDIKDIFDVKIFEHMIKSEKRSYLLKDLAFDYSNMGIGERINPNEMSKALDIVEEIRDKQFEHVKQLELYEYTKKSISKYFEIDTDLMLTVHKKLDIPISCILASMEDRGIKLDKNKLDELREEVDTKISELEKNIYDTVGHEFNINSTKQLADILFVELQLPKSTKLSTKESVLNKMVGMHPIIEMILEYREVKKISTTYVEPLVAIINESESDGAVHTDFKQIGTSSGRFSSVNPNMQNIPIDNQWASKVRRCFVPRNGFTFLGIDYSQMELRIMADISKDKALTQDFLDKLDIHSATAARILGKDVSEITKKERSLGKTINFGMIFGQTSYGLARLLNLSVEECSKYIRDYFEAYSGVEEYMRDIEDIAKKNGYVQSMFGTTRNIKGIRSVNKRLASSAAREAINMPIQGSEADIMKYVMLKIDNLIKDKYQDNAYMLLQIHDEILFEIENTAVESFEKDAKEIMINSVKLDVPLDIHFSKGFSWDELK